MATANQYLKTMLEMSSGLSKKYFGPPIECSACTDLRDEGHKENEDANKDDANVVPKQRMRLHNLHKEASYWENKVQQCIANYVVLKYETRTSKANIRK